MESVLQSRHGQLTSVVLRSSVDGTTDKHKDTADDDAGFTTVSISDCRDCEHGENGADSVHVCQETEEIGLGCVRSNVIKVTLPVVVRLQEIEKGPRVEHSQ
jgi:hypothetical protein